MGEILRFCKNYNEKFYFSSNLLLSERDKNNFTSAA